MQIPPCVGLRRTQDASSFLFVSATLHETFVCRLRARKEAGVSSGRFIFVALHCIQVLLKPPTLIFGEPADG